MHLGLLLAPNSYIQHRKGQVRCKSCNGIDKLATIRSINLVALLLRAALLSL
jgi:hypothetical protein